ncbi:MAG: hypothetical protein WCY77_10325 [Weeksellaceae bacterium]
MKVSLSTMKNWFRNGMKPDENKFWNVFDSFWHKDDPIAINDVEYLQTALDNKANSNHSHDEYAATDASNIHREEWLEVLDLTEPKDSGVELTQEYAEIGTNATQKQSDFNLSVNDKIQALRESLATKLRAPDDIVGDYMIRVSLDEDEEFEVEYVPISVGSNPVPENHQHTITESDIKTNSIEIMLPNSVNTSAMLLLYVRGLYVGRNCYSVLNNTITIDSTLVDYAINSGDLVDIIYYKN